MVATSASCTATAAAPAASLTRVAVVRWTSTPVWKASSEAASAKEGSSVPKRTRLSCRRGVSAPGSKASSSSRGKKPGLTDRADAIAALEGEGLPTLGLQRARVETAGLERAATLRAGRRRGGALIAPVGGRAGKRQVFEHARP